MEVAATKTAFPKYPAYKESGVEWLGNIPSDWNLGKLGTLLKPISIKGQPDLPLLSITRELGVIERNLEEDEGNHNFIPDDLSGYKVIREGQFGMNKMKAWQGSYGISRFTGIVSPAYYVFDFTSEIDPRFFHYAIRSKNYVAFFGRASDGVRIGQWDLSKSRMKEIPFFIPTPTEQTAIAAFLDNKTAKIDRAIAQKVQLIALLKERKQIIIQNAVTKGLDPNAKMKHSGVEWIGEIPEGWEVKRLKYVLKERNERSATGDEPLLMMSQVHGLVVRSEFHDKAEVAASSVGNKLVQHGDLVFNKLKAHLGVFFKSTVDFKGLVSPDYAVYYSNGLIQDVKYLELLFKHPVYIGQFIIRATGVAEGLIRLYTGDLFEIPIPIPPKEEQAETLAFIETYSSQVDLLIGSNQSQIEKLKEYKATLIDSAVTGKIKVSF
jgi:type I restriction enzyme S subunit